MNKPVRLPAQLVKVFASYRVTMRNAAAHASQHIKKHPRRLSMTHSNACDDFRMAGVEDPIWVGHRFSQESEEGEPQSSGIAIAMISGFNDACVPSIASGYLPLRSTAGTLSSVRRQPWGRRCDRRESDGQKYRQQPITHRDSNYRRCLLIFPAADGQLRYWWISWEKELHLHRSMPLNDINANKAG